MIEFQYFENCPNSAETLKNLRDLLRGNFLPDHELKITEIPDTETAESHNFQGSPTILYKGVDIYTGLIPEDSRFVCRVYEIDGVRTGVLSKDFIEERINRIDAKAVMITESGHT